MQMKYILSLLIFISYITFSFPAWAMTCRNYAGHQICILSIQRSAKKYWEYQASVSVDGVKTPVEIYNCRGRFKIQKDKTVVQFSQNSPGEMICSFFKK